MRLGDICSYDINIATLVRGLPLAVLEHVELSQSTLDTWSDVTRMVRNYLKPNKQVHRMHAAMSDVDGPKPVPMCKHPDRICHLPAALVFCHNNNILSVKTVAFAFYPSVVRSLLYVSRTDILEPVGAVSSPCALRRQYSERNIVVYPCRNPTLRTSNTPWFLRVTEGTDLSQVMSTSTRTKSMNPRDLLARNGQATPMSHGGLVSRRTTSNSLPVLPSVLSNQF